MRKPLALLFAAALVTVCVGQQKITVDSVPDQRLWLYLLIGQSNMVGQGADYDSNRVMGPQPRIYKLGYAADTTTAAINAQGWYEAYDPVHSQPAYLTPWGWAEAGPAMGFSMRVTARFPNIHVGLIPCAINGSELARWEKGGDLYTWSVKRAKRAMRDGVLKGILMHQGEQDATPGLASPTYGTRLAKAIKDMRHELAADSVSFVLANLGEWTYDAQYYPAANIAQVKAGYVYACKNTNHTYLVPTTGLVDKGDLCHFSTHSAVLLGRRYADTVFTHLGDTASTTVAANPPTVSSRNANVSLVGTRCVVSFRNATTAIGRSEVYSIDGRRTTALRSWGIGVIAVSLRSQGKQTEGPTGPAQKEDNH